MAVNLQTWVFAAFDRWTQVHVARIRSWRMYEGSEFPTGTEMQRIHSLKLYIIVTYRLTHPTTDTDMLGF